jgi:hypothetical protein
MRMDGRMSGSRGDRSLDDPFKKIPPCLFHLAHKRTDGGVPQLLVEWSNGKQSWAAIKHMRVLESGQVIWKQSPGKKPSGILVENVSLASGSQHTDLTQRVSSMTLDESINSSSIEQQQPELSLNCPTQLKQHAKDTSQDTHLDNTTKDHDPRIRKISPEGRSSKNRKTTTVHRTAGTR